MKYLRIKRKKEFEKILKNGKRAFSETLTLVYTPAKELKMAVCVGKKFGKSVQRNHIKRLLREAFRGYADRICPCSVLLIPRVRGEYSYAAFSRDLGKMFSKGNFFESRDEKSDCRKREISPQERV